MLIPVMYSISELALSYDKIMVIEFELPDPEGGTPGTISPVGGSTYCVKAIHNTYIE